MPSTEAGWAPVAEVFPEEARQERECEEGFIIGPSDYQALMCSFRYLVVLWVEDHDYSGDTRVLFEDHDNYGFLRFGWGSCSGCDALQACSTLADVEELRRELHSEIRWGTRCELLDFMQGHDREGDYDYHSEETRRFVRAAIALLLEPAEDEGEEPR